MKKQANKQKAIIIIAVLLVFGIGAYVTTSGEGERLTSEQEPQRKAKAVDQDKLPIEWAEVETKEELNDFYRRQIPKIDQIRERELMTSPGQSMTVPDKEGRVQINEVWHSGQQIFYLYSIDLSLLVEEEGDTNHYLNDPPQVDQLKIEETGDIQSQTLHAFSSLRHNEAVIFENRLYGIIHSMPIMKEGMDDPYMSFSQMPESFQGTAKTSIRFRINGETIETEAIPVPYSYDPDKQTIATLPFSGSYSDNGLTIEPTELVMSVSTNYIKMRIKDDNNLFNHTLEGRVISDDQEVPFSPRLQKIDGEENMYRAFFGPLNESSTEIPDKLSLDIRNVHLIKENPYSFTFELPELEGTDHVNKELTKKVAEKYETNVYLQDMNYHKNHGLTLSLRYTPKDAGQKEKLVGTTIFNGQTPPDQTDHISVVTDNGNDGFVGTGGSERTSRLDIPDSLLDGASSVTVTFNEVVVANKIDQTFTIDTQSE
ncbi:hypothetical protein H0266_17550 [Halobacillus locisalis]|uniref:DUF4179 domain-containing protein n=1 Tax=Halobacillus locisalis TaxID=220753 RepID=A0A838CXC6_9BACI|nr:hypothetical protein [Halobacillus locisalis]MBA2176697.1 hypothetical protein [Halobacillus locisalis]